MVVSKDTVQHYRWGADCDGWLLAPGTDMLVIQEQMPPGTMETRHFHSSAKQFFFVLSGELAMEKDGAIHRLLVNEGIEIEPTVLDQARNDSDREVISAPTTRGDRTECN